MLVELFVGHRLSAALTLLVVLFGFCALSQQVVVERQNFYDMFAGDALVQHRADVPEVVFELLLLFERLLLPSAEVASWDFVGRNRHVLLTADLLCHFL